MSDVETYDERVRAIRAYNQPILDDFRNWLEQSGLAEKTVKAHVFNIDFFTEYLVYKESAARETPAQIRRKQKGRHLWQSNGSYYSVKLHMSGKM